MHQFSCANASNPVRKISERSPLPANGLCQPVALAGEDHNVGMVDQPVHQRRCKAVVAKDGVPLGELKVGYLRNCRVCVEMPSLDDPDFENEYRKHVLVARNTDSNLISKFILQGVHQNILLKLLNRNGTPTGRKETEIV